MHPAHPLAEGDVTFGAGFSGKVAVDETELAPEQVSELALSEGAFAPGMAPWVGGRIGIDGAFEAGLTYTGRSIRADGRHAWVFGDSALSLGIGASGLLPARDEELALRVGGFGADVPLLFGYLSEADIYALWIGVRGGGEYLRGQRDLPEDPLIADAPLETERISGWHAYAGGLAGMRVGFRYIFAVLEVDAAMHWAEGDVGEASVAVQQFSVAPAGALVVRF